MFCEYSDLAGCISIRFREHLSQIVGTQIPFLDIFVRFVLLPFKTGLK